MALHIQTGNMLDVVEELVDGKFEITGLYHRGENGKGFIPLPDPQALMEVLQFELNRSQ